MIFAALREIRRLQKTSATTETVVEPVPFLRLLRLAPWGLLLIFMAKVGTFENARQLAPYYACLLYTSRCV